MTRYDDTAAPVQKTVYLTPAGEAITTTGQGFVLATAMLVAIVIFVNIAAVALHAWHSQVFWHSLLIGLLPWGFLMLGLFRRLFRFAWPIIETITNKDWDDSGEIGDPKKWPPREQDIRVVPVFGRANTTDQVDNRDLRTFVRTICQTKDWTQARWRGRQLPSGRTCDNAYHAALVGPLVKIQAIQGYGPRKTGFLAEEDANEICKRLGI